ncbi:MAG: TlpA disulfide reductase family protein [Planctomycetota bacterium]
MNRKTRRPFELRQVAFWAVSPFAFLGLCLVSIGQAQDDFVGPWEFRIRGEGYDIDFGVELKKENDEWSGFLVNGEEQIPIPSTVVDPKSLTLEIPHYDSKLEFDVVRIQDGTPILNGVWKKRRSKTKWVTMKAQGSPGTSVIADPTAAKSFAGRWSVKFSKSDDLAVGIFEAKPDGKLQGTFLTTTGDYRFLAGSATGNTMKLSCFDGAHAFAFTATRQDDGSLNGDFWSSNTWHETFVATRDEDAKLPDSFQQTLVNQKVRLSDFEFPNLDGEPVNLDAEQFRGKPRIVYVFGSWCPNCHDAAAYFSQMQKQYAKTDLAILGIAFELTGDFERDAKQVKRYLERHQCTYPVLIAGTSDKKLASKTFPLLDRVRSYPTTIFIDRQGKVTAVHTGFSGPATGEDYTRLKAAFEKNIAQIIQK